MKITYEIEEKDKLDYENAVEANLIALEEGTENPTKYTRIDTFTLNNPIPNDETATFIGWSGTDLEDLTDLEKEDEDEHKKK